MRASLLFLLFFLTLLFPPVVFSKETSEGAKKYKTALFPSGTKIKMEVADTPKARHMGLMFRDQIPAGTGMLFVFPVEALHRFWMKNCKFPIDMVWLNKRNQIVYIAQDVPPCKSDPCPDYGPNDQPALYVIETSAGFSKKERLRIGATVRF
jgi:uncharacterized membrane protein (UPF0127 family)